MRKSVSAHIGEAEMRRQATAPGGREPLAGFVAAQSARPTHPRRGHFYLLAAVALALALAGCSSSSTSSSTSAPTSSSTSSPTSSSTSSPPSGALIGLFKITAGSCSGGGVTSGSYFRMAQPGGSYISNSSSPCGDKTYTPLSPGSAGGLSTTAYQPGTILTQPQGFYGIDFTTSTNPVDPQTGVQVPVPSI